MKLQLFGFLAVLALEPVTGMADTTAGDCMSGPMAQFGRYVGDWKIDDEQLKQDGSAWVEGKGARWRFDCIGGGTAVQDYWMPNDGGFGTNLRTYNPDTGSWEIVWAATSHYGLMHITAKQNDLGNIVMDVVAPVQDPARRITFYEPRDNGWDWNLEFSYDGGTTWVEVYRIKATPWDDGA